MKRILKTIVRDTGRYSVSNSSSLTLPNQNDLTINKLELQGGATATTEDIVIARKGINLIDKSKFPATQTINGVTFTNNGDGTITVDGTAGTESSWAIFSLIREDITIQKSRQYLMMGCPRNGSTETYFLRDGWNSIKPDIGNGRISSSIGTKSAPMIQIMSGTTVSNLVFKPQLYDLTAIYGEGNEPTTVEQFLKDYPEYEPYLPPKSLTFSSAYPLSSTDKLSITRQSVKYNDTDITSEVTGLDEFFSLENDTTVLIDTSVSMSEITADTEHSVISYKRAVYTGKEEVTSSQTFIK